VRGWLIVQSTSVSYGKATAVIGKDVPIPLLLAIVPTHWRERCAPS
jgi:hypothetical protein